MKPVPVMTTDYSSIRASTEAGVARVVIDNPPVVNVLDVQLMGELQHLLKSVRHDESVRVIVFESADPEIFIAHVDMTLIDEPNAFAELARNARAGLNPFQSFAERLRRQPQVNDC